MVKTRFQPKQPGECLYKGRKFYQLPLEYRMSVLMADGQWWSPQKLVNMTSFNDPRSDVVITSNLEDVERILQQLVDDGVAVRSETGAKSYRYPLESVKNWYFENNIDYAQRLVATNFPVRLFGGMTEVEGFLSAPLRECASISFANVSERVTYAVREALAGVAVVRRGKTNRIFVRALSEEPARSIIEDTLSRFEESKNISTSVRRLSYRRPVADLPPEFHEDMMNFYVMFLREILKGRMETIRVFLPAEEDQVAQLAEWVTEAVEKYNEMESVPLSGFLQSTVPYWALDLPQHFLGKELAVFQRHRSKAIKELRKERNVDANTEFTYRDIADKMGIEFEEFLVLKEQNDTWFRQRNMDSITWGEDSVEERPGQPVFGITATPDRDYNLSSRVLFAALGAAEDTGRIDDLLLVSQCSSGDDVAEAAENLSPEYVGAFTRRFGSYGA